MKKAFEKQITNAKYFQQNGSYDLAIDSLKTAQYFDVQKAHEVEIEKLLAFNYRKLNDFDKALFHINKAIKAAESSSDDLKKEFAICLMNRGIIYEELKNPDKALDSYLPALDIFLTLFNSSPENHGFIINALLTIGLLFYNAHRNSDAKQYLEKSLQYFNSIDHKESDRRYLAITNTLKELNEASDS